MWLLLPLIIWPLVEIALFVTVGGWLGLWPTLAWVVVSALLGMVIIRRQGEKSAIAMRQGIGALSDPVSPMAEGAMKVLAGALLILPGFLTDAAGLVLLLPPVRKAIIALVSRRVVVRGQSYRRPDHRPDIIDGEFIELNDENTDQHHGPGTGPNNGPNNGSGWTRP